MPARTVAVIASGRDKVAARVAQAIERRGWTALRLDGPSVARVFTIRVTGGVPEVTPGLPVFMRGSAWIRDGELSTADQRFLAVEEYSALWAALALASAPVINRPGPHGWRHRLTAAEIRLLLDTPRPVPAEVHASGPRQVRLAVPGRVAWGSTAGDGTGPVADMSDGVPLRARAVDPGAAYEVITVVGERGFAAGARARDLRLTERSARLASRAGLHFATATWSVSEDGTEPEPVRLDADPAYRAVRGVWDDVADALCADLVE